MRWFVAVLPLIAVRIADAVRPDSKAPKLISKEAAAKTAAAAATDDASKEAEQVAASVDGMSFSAAELQYIKVAQGMPDLLARTIAKDFVNRKKFGPENRVEQVLQAVRSRVSHVSLLEESESLAKELPDVAGGFLPDALVKSIEEAAGVALSSPSNRSTNASQAEAPEANLNAASALNQTEQRAVQASGTNQTTELSAANATGTVAGKSTSNSTDASAVNGSAMVTDTVASKANAVATASSSVVAGEQSGSNLTSTVVSQRVTTAAPGFSAAARRENLDRLLKQARAALGGSKAFSAASPAAVSPMA
eukprot:TRINITY_DN100488_c0_g1_i1.p1 TRINITY_DN100488_c0_g1~~TRINITY_DN100488_c0_g1_i1.p1  ORF type:complete len:308 (+),score=70.36 TRINITY_DN100488_c0_g1_i1:162-1085(+)